MPGSGMPSFEEQGSGGLTMKRMKNVLCHELACELCHELACELCHELAR